MMNSNMTPGGSNQTGNRLHTDGVARRRLRVTGGLLGASVALLLVSCAHPQSSLEQIRERGTLRMVTLNAPTCYYLGAHGPEGMEYQLAAAFARTLGVQLVVQAVPDAAAMRRVLATGHADLAAAQITADASWLKVGVPTSTYQQVAELVVQSRGRPVPHGIAELRNARVAVFADSPQQALLQELRSRELPELAWTALPRDRADPLDLLGSGGADYAVVDANEFAFAQHLFPESVVAFALPEPRALQWVVPTGADGLLQAADAFLAHARTSGELAHVESDSASESRAFDYVSAHTFQSDIARRLPALQQLFQDAAQATGLDWRLLAAIGYQESKWQREAASADGAEGIMMLTSDAAATVGVDDRANLRENILGGARYLAQVIDSIPKRIGEPDRTWFALAAYNVGYGHLEDARVLAQIHGKNPDSWADVRQQLPLLAQEQWYARARRGYARGWEPVGFVEQVRQYLAVLEWLGADSLVLNRVMPERAYWIAAFDDNTRAFN